MYVYVLRITTTSSIIRSKIEARAGSVARASGVGQELANPPHRRVKGLDEAEMRPGARAALLGIVAVAPSPSETNCFCILY